MSWVIAAPEYVAAAATDLAGIGSTLSTASAAAAVPTSAVLAAGADEVSAAISALFNWHAQAYQILSAQAQAFHNQFVQLMSAGAGQYAVAEAANASPMQQVEALVTNPLQTLTGPPPVGNGASGTARAWQSGDGGGSPSNGGFNAAGQNAGNSWAGSIGSGPNGGVGERVRMAPRPSPPQIPDGFQVRAQAACWAAMQRDSLALAQGQQLPVAPATESPPAVVAALYSAMAGPARAAPWAHKRPPVQSTAHPWIAPRPLAPEAGAATTATPVGCRATARIMWPAPVEATLPPSISPADKRPVQAASVATVGRCTAAAPAAVSMAHTRAMSLPSCSALKEHPGPRSFPQLDGHLTAAIGRLNGCPNSPRSKRWSTIYGGTPSVWPSAASMSRRFRC